MINYVYISHQAKLLKPDLFLKQTSLVWLYLVKMRIILGRKKCFNEC